MQDDLQAFQLEHFFTTNAGSRHVTSLNNNTGPWVSPGVALYEDDDGLGYYPDGVKRTLTDEQVAIFRNSEIYSLLRSRQRQEQHQDTHDGVRLNLLDLDPKQEGEEAQSLSAGHGQQNLPDHGSSDDEGEYLKFIEAEQEKMRAVQAKKKRKRTQTNSNRDDRPHTHRRIARELDIATSKDVPLPYDDDGGLSPNRDFNTGENRGSDGPPTKDNHSTEDKQEDKSSPEVKHEGDQPPVGRKVWWPTIGE